VTYASVNVNQEPTYFVLMWANWIKIFHLPSPDCFKEESTLGPNGMSNDKWNTRELQSVTMMEGAAFDWTFAVLLHNYFQ
jgi:hypothetical protein